MSGAHHITRPGTFPAHTAPVKRILCICFIQGYFPVGPLTGSYPLLWINLFSPLFFQTDYIAFYTSSIITKKKPHPDVYHSGVVSFYWYTILWIIRTGSDNSASRCFPKVLSRNWMSELIYDAHRLTPLPASDIRCPKESIWHRSFIRIYFGTPHKEQYNISPFPLMYISLSSGWLRPCLILTLPVEKIFIYRIILI